MEKAKWDLRREIDSAVFKVDTRGSTYLHAHGNWQLLTTGLLTSAEGAPHVCPRIIDFEGTPSIPPTSQKKVHMGLTLVLFGLCFGMGLVSEGG